MLESIKKLVELSDIAQTIINSDVTWDEKYDAIFSKNFMAELDATGFSISWSDPDTSCEEDVLAFANALREKADGMRKILLDNLRQ